MMTAGVEAARPMSAREVPISHAPEVTALTTDIVPATEIKIGVRHLNLCYGSVQALKNVELELGAHEITALIGPSGCGKSSFLRCLNRMNDTRTRPVDRQNLVESQGGDIKVESQLGKGSVFTVQFDAFTLMN